MLSVDAPARWKGECKAVWDVLCSLFSVQCVDAVCSLDAHQGVKVCSMSCCSVFTVLMQC